MSEIYGQTVRRLRGERGWTQDELADRAGIPKRTLQDVEAGNGTKGPQRRTREKIDAALGLGLNAEAEVIDALIAAAQDWPRDVRTMVLIIGQWFAALPETDRDREFSAVLLRVTGGR